MEALQVDEAQQKGMERAGPLRQKFSPSEDRIIMELYPAHPNDWAYIARRMNRNPRQIRDRYKHYLDPDLNLGPWSEEENRRLEEKVLLFGNHWSVISKYFPHRSEVNIKNHWASYSQRLRRMDVISPTSSGLPSSEDTAANQKSRWAHRPIESPPPIPLINGARSKLPPISLIVQDLALFPCPQLCKC